MIDEALQRDMRALVRRLGLHYGSIDMRLTPEGKYVFFEINPSGQFLFIEIDTGHPLSNAMAAMLLSARSKPSQMGSTTWVDGWETRAGRTRQ
ncbi:hypothetical protein [Rhizobium sp. Root1220]|uniref:hypothetical protein n=1 Tax=Rhizobium sp. Root1220 TaxID=1736432 RepID=UPI0012E33AC2|nr:hypothetical protein [Rhizobium sp. Root1220]